MISNNEQLLPWMVNELNKSQFQFHLTGSRFFGGMKSADTDWDFFACDSDEIRQFLEGFGFENQSSMYESDLFLETVYTYVLIDKGVKHKYDVQLVRPDVMRRKMHVQEFLKNHYGDSGLPGDKDHRSEIWSLLYRFSELQES